MCEIVEEVMNSQLNETINWYQFIKSLKKQWGRLLIAGIGGCLFFLLVTIFFIPNKYNSTVDLLVNQKSSSNDANYTNQQADLQAINTYKDVLKKEVILEPVLKEIKAKNNYQGGIDSLRSSISITNETDSQVLSVVVSDGNPYVAADVANTVGKVFTSKIKSMMKVDNVTIVTKGSPAKKPSFPNRKIISLVGFFVGLLMEVLIISLKTFFDKTIKDSSFLNENLGLANLGTVYHIKKGRNLKIINVSNNVGETAHSKARV